MKHEKLIQQMMLEEKCYLLSGKKRKAANSPNYKLDYMLEYKEDKHQKTN